MRKPETKFVLIAAASFLIAACDTNTGPDLIQTNDPTLDIRINVDASVIDGAYTLNAGNFPASLYHRGFVSLRDTGNGVATMLGESWEGGYDSLMVVDGSYDSIFQHIDGNLVPQNSMAMATTAHTSTASTRST